MCGVVAALEPSSAFAGLDPLRRAVASLAHRGPDRAAMFRQGPVSLGHTRLAIVDVEHGNQPLTSADGALVLVANGEIYNAGEITHRAAANGLTTRTRSDNEAILIAYQLDPDHFLERLHGMFAFVLVDFARQQLIAGRDRLGIKPLFLHQTRGRLLLASEIKALLQFPGVECRPNAASIGDILTFGYPMGDATAFDGITSVPPGHMLVARFDEPVPAMRPYWQPDVAALAGSRLDEHASIGRLRNAVEDAVRSHLMGEVDHLLYLSEGLDSSILARLLTASAESGKPEQALSLHFAERRFDESTGAQTLAEQLGMAFDVVGDRDWTLDDLAGAVRALEQPQIVTLDLSIQALSRAARHKGCKFVFAGDGADELFGGYDHFGLAKGRDFIAASLPPGSRHAALERLLRTRGYPADFGRHYLAQHEALGLQGWDREDPRALPWHPVWSANDGFRKQLMPDLAHDSFSRDGPMATMWRRLAPSPGGLKPIQSYVCFELLSRLPNWILLKSDRNAMVNAIEVRVPFLDCDVIDAALACPPELVGAPLHEKLPLKRAFADCFNPELLARAKRAFNTPHGWVFGRAAAALDEVLAPAALERIGLFDARAVSAMRAEVARAYAGGTQPEAMLSVLQAQTLLGVITTQLLFATDFRTQPAGDIELVGIENTARALS